MTYREAGELISSLRAGLPRPPRAYRRTTRNNFFAPEVYAVERGLITHREALRIIRTCSQAAGTATPSDPV